jgi:hypothetical protein
VAAGGAIEPKLAIAALVFVQSLLFPAFGTLPIHLSLLDVIGEEQAATRTFFRAWFADGGTAGGQRADENGLAGAAPVFTFFFFLTDGTFFHNKLSGREGENRSKKISGDPQKRITR